jgi:hypothetical protein
MRGHRSMGGGRVPFMASFAEGKIQAYRQSSVPTTIWSR